MNLETGIAPAWHVLPEAVVIERLGSQPEGLTSQEAAIRFARHGPNVLAEAKAISPLRILASQFQNVIVLVLVAAAVLSGATGEWADAVAIFAIVVLNAVIGFLQEFKAEKSLAALKKMTAPKARVRRDDRAGLIAAAEVVPGDIIEMEAGDVVAADARLLEAAALRTVESSLTGESQPVGKHAAPLPRPDLPLGDRANMIYLGTTIAAGRATGVVVATGMATEIGHIAGLLAAAEDETATPLQKSLDRFGRFLLWVSLGVVALVFVLGLLRGIPTLELLLTSVSLAVAAVPEGLPAVVTVALALGVQRMARKRSLIRRLAAVETLGCASRICTDKTGTLTVGEMTVRAVHAPGASFRVTGEGYSPAGRVESGAGPLAPPQEEAVREIARVAAACNAARLVEADGAWAVIGDPTEGALLSFAAKGGIVREAVEREEARVKEFPFDSDRRRMTIVRRLADGRIRAYVKGAPDVILDRCVAIRGEDGLRPLTPDRRREIEDAVARMASDAMRVLAMAWRDLDDGGDQAADDVERELVFVGLTGMVDPPRPEARRAVALCRSAGIQVAMITGDHPETAEAIAKELGIWGAGGPVLTGRDLDAMSEDDLRRRVADTAVYARVTAAHKLRIVRALRAQGEIVAMTGDGVNDAPAIKGADIGIAMGRSGTEVTKEASDMVITDDDFATIVAAVEEGRGIYANIRKTLLYLLSGNVGEILVMTAAVVTGVPMPLLPIHLLWINLVTDGLPALCLATDPVGKDLMTMKPRRRRESLTDPSFLRLMGVSGLITAATTFGVYLFTLRTETVEMARAHAFCCLVFIEIFKSFVFRNEEKTLWQVGIASNLRLVGIAALSLVCQLAAPEIAWLGRFLEVPPMPPAHLVILLAVSLIPPTILEALKVLRRKRAMLLLG